MIGPWSPRPRPASPTPPAPWPTRRAVAGSWPRASGARPGSSAPIGRCAEDPAARSSSVRLRGRPWPAVLADMIEGVVAVNELAPPAATRVRTDLWELVTDDAAARGCRSGWCRRKPGWRRRRGVRACSSGSSASRRARRYRFSNRATSAPSERLRMRMPPISRSRGGRLLVGAADRLVAGADRISIGALNSLSRRWPNTSNCSCADGGQHGLGVARGRDRAAPAPRLLRRAGRGPCGTA